MVARAKAAQEFLPAESERAAQEAYGRQMLNTTEIEEPGEQDPDDVALQNVLSELGSGTAADSKVNIYQLDPKNSRSFVGSFLPSEFSLERIQHEYGPGDYEIRVYGGNKKLSTRKVIKIAAPKNGVQAFNPHQQNPINSEKLVETMNAGFQQLGQMFAQALSGLVNNQPKPKSTMEMLQEMQLMKQILGLDSHPAPAGPDPMAMITMALDLSEKIRPREGEPSAGEIILKAVESFAPAINEMVTTNATRQPAPAVASAPALTLNPAMLPPVPHPSQVPQQQQNPPEEDMNLAMKIYTNTLLAAAQKDADTLTYANNILDMLPEKDVLDFLNAPNWWQEVITAVPNAVPFAPWFQALKTDILDLTAPEEDTSVEADAKTVPSQDATK